MILLIDGYNVIRFLYPDASAAREEYQALFFKQLAQYRAAKKEVLEEIVVVLDGGLFAHKTREMHKGIAVVQSGHKRKADDVLVEYGAQLRSRAVVVTNDRELQRRLLVHACSSVSVSEFWDMVSAVCARQREESESLHVFGKTVITKYTADDEEEGDTHIDALMIAGSVRAPGGVDDAYETNKKKQSSSCAVSKKDKAAQSLRKKLG